MSFHPPLNTSTSIPLTPRSSTIYFSYTPSPVTEHNDRAPEIWTNLPSGTWHAVPFVARTAELWTAEISVEPHEEGAPAGETRFEYTYRLRAGDHVEWLGWDGGNGVVHFVAGGDDDSRCPFALAATGEEKGDRLRLVSFPLKAGVSGDVETFQLAELKDGTDWDGVVWERSAHTWYYPRVLPAPNPVASVSPTYEGQLLYFRSRRSHQILVLFPFSSQHVSSSLRRSPDNDSSIVLRATRDSSIDGENATARVVAAWGMEGDLHELVDRCVVAARAVLSPTVPSPPSATFNGPHGLTWCTWNALGPNFTISAVLASLDAFSAPSASTASHLYARTIDSVLLDDGWQDVRGFPDAKDPGRERRGLWSFGVKDGWYDLEREKAGGRERMDSGYEGSPSRIHGQELAGERGAIDGLVGWELGEAVKQIKARGVKRVGVWMTLAGYWDAINPSSPISKAYPLHQWENTAPDWNETTTWHVPVLASLSAYYKGYFSALASAGIAFVKVDDQAHQDFILADGSDEDSGMIRKEMLRAMKDAALEVFGGSDPDRAVVHCMAGSPRIWGGELAIVGPSPSSSGNSIVRNSDDYFPDRVDSHRRHIYVNSYTTILTRSLRFWPDFDMCEEAHPWGPFHIAFRAFSPAPTFATDHEGAAADLGAQIGWEAMIARTRQGSKLLKTRAALGAVLEGRIGEDTLGGGEGKAHKVGLKVSEARGALIGMWNCREGEAGTKDVIDSKDVADALGRHRSLGSKDGYVVYFDRKGTFYRVGGDDVQAAAAPAPRALALPIAWISLGHRDYAIATVSPLFVLHPASSSSSSYSDKPREPIEIACLGLLGKHAGLVAISSIDVVQSHSHSTYLAGLPTPPLVRSLARQPSTTFPHARNSHLALFLTSFFGRPRSAQNLNTANSEPAAPALSLSSFLRNPFTTTWTEVRAFAAFCAAVLVWTVGMAVPVARQRLLHSHSHGYSEKLSGASEDAEADVDAKKSTEVLRIDLAFVSERLGFYVSGDEEGAAAVRFLVEGKAVGEHLVKREEVGDGGWKVQLMLEEALKAGGEEAIMGAGGREGWVVEVTC